MARPSSVPSKIIVPAVGFWSGDKAGDGRFAGARFADQAQGFAAVDVEVHTVDGVDDAAWREQALAADRKVLDQASHGE